MSRRLPGIVAVAFATLTLAASGCDARNEDGDAASTTAAGEGCGVIIEEQLDPASSQHVFPGAPAPTYLSDPPTSGPHQAVAEGRNPQFPLSKPIQVGHLERGDVLIQVATDPVPNAIPRAVPDAIVFHNPELPAPVVATAWLHKMLCESPDVDALQDFVSRFVGKGADAH